MLPSPPLSTTIEPKLPPDSDALALPEPIIAPGSVSPDYKPPTSPRGRNRRNHSEIERRRRERVNAKYNELRELVPTCRAFRFARRGGDAGLHKLDILTEAVKHIRTLQQDLEATRKRNSRDVTRISYLVN